MSFDKMALIKMLLSDSDSDSDSAPSAPTPAPAPKERPILVTTAHRGVFFGYSANTDGETLAIRRARNVVYWSADVRGFMGLAATGPTAGCRIGPAVSISVRNITSVTEVTEAAMQAFESAPWSK